MAKFKYRARTKEGELQIGTVEALNRDEAEDILRSHNLYVLFLDEIKGGQWYSRVLSYLNRVKRKDLMVFTRQFATLLSAKIPLDRSLLTLQRQTKNPLLRDVIGEVAADIDAGLSLSQALSKYNYVFSDFYVNMIRSAEVTGRVEESMEFLAEYIEKQTELVGRVRNALIYPFVMIGLFIIVGGIMVTIVFPQIGPVFEEAGVKLPIFTRVLLSAGTFLAHFWWLVFLFLIVGGGFLYEYLRSSEGRVLVDEIGLRTPVVKNLIRGLYVSRFAESLSVLIKGGIPIAQAIEVTGHTIGSVVYRDALHRASLDVRKGEPLSQSLASQERIFPPLVAQMVAVGESSGQLDALLDKIADFYAREVDGLVHALVELIQPLLLVVIGVLVGGLFASILIPIYNLAQTF